MKYSNIEKGIVLFWSALVFLLGIDRGVTHMHALVKLIGIIFIPIVFYTSIKYLYAAYLEKK